MPAADPIRHDDLNLLRRAAAEAGKIAMRYFGRKPEVWMKNGTSPVSEADYAVDKYLRETLLAARPDYGWLSEETVDDKARLGSRLLFVADPIDGTRGYLEGNKRWCVCIAVVENGVPLAGVLDCPATGEHFWAACGLGAWEGEKRISIAESTTDFAIGGPENWFNRLPEEWKARSRRTTYIPSLAYRIAMIAAGRLDATFIKANAQDWDLAAASIILEEAGGRIVNSDGNSPFYGSEITTHQALAAGSGPLLTAMTAVLSEHQR